MRYYLFKLTMMMMRAHLTTFLSYYGFHILCTSGTLTTLQASKLVRDTEARKVMFFNIQSLTTLY